MSVYVSAARPILKALLTQKSRTALSRTTLQKSHTPLKLHNRTVERFKFGMQNPEDFQLEIPPQDMPHPIAQSPQSPLHAAFHNLHEYVHRIPPFTGRDVAELIVPTGFLGGSIMYLINDFTNDDGINGKTLAGDIMTFVASCVGTGLVLHNWVDRYRRRRQVNAQPPSRNNPFENT